MSCNIIITIDGQEPVEHQDLSDLYEAYFRLWEAIGGYTPERPLSAKIEWNPEKMRIKK